MAEKLTSAPNSGSVFSPNDWGHLAAAMNLSGRERQILEALFDGLKDAAIARRLAMPTNTVRSHFTRLHRKLRVSSRVELMVHVFKVYLRLLETDREKDPPLIEVRGRRLTHVRT